MDDAARGAAEILDGWAPILVGVELRTGTRGTFKVTLDDEVIYDKAARGRRPQPGELRKLVTDRLGPALVWRKTHTPSRT